MSGQAADKHTGVVAEIFLAAGCMNEAADLIRIRTDRLNTAALLTHCIDICASLGPNADSAYEAIWPTGIKPALVYTLPIHLDSFVISCI
jgi:hypothetical protein